MKKLGFLLKVVVLFSVLSATVLVAQAQATRSWVASHASGGDDVNPCSRTAPCKTFAGAISKTAEGGEIDAVDPDGYGVVTITKAITIDGGTGSGWASILTPSGNGVTVNISTSGVNHPDNAVVILRNLTITGIKQANNGGDMGINILRAFQVHVENANIQHFINPGINVDATDSVSLFVNNVTLTRNTTAIKMTTTSGLVVAQINHINVQGTSNGVNAVANSRATIRDSYFGGLSSATIGAVHVATGCVVNVENSMFSNDELAVNVDTGGTVRISDNCFYNNSTALAGTGTIATATNTNKFAGNGTDGTTNDVIVLK
jgi:hypothetical protein